MECGGRYVMSPMAFSGTQEHALLALIIQEAHQSRTVPYLGRTALQKITYFLKALGVPMRYSFDIHHYGPYSDQIPSDIELLMADGIIEDLSTTTTKYWNYAPKPGEPLDRLLEQHESFVRTHRRTVERVVDSLGPLDPRELELFATLHYAYRYEMASTSKPSRDAVLARFKEYKGNKFPPDELTAAYDTMVDMSLIRIPPSSPPTE
jgi:uncharacterized protein